MKYWSLAILTDTWLMKVQISMILIKLDWSLLHYLVINVIKIMLQETWEPMIDNMQKHPLIINNHNSWKNNKLANLKTINRVKNIKMI